jgi:hypothetical protein
MAKGNRTTSTSRRATAAKATPAASVSKATDTIRRDAERATDQQYNLGHLAALLAMVGDEIGTPFADRPTLEWQELGCRVEYLAAQLKRHTADLATALAGVEGAVTGLRVGGGQ